MSVSLIDRRVTLRELRLFLAVAQSGSILKAANEIGLTQPALSKSIAELERTFGVRLFDRTNRGVTTTPQGEVLLRRATGMFEELRQAVDELGALADASIGELRLGGTP
ncbi:MAG: LysR family transcriptional regulator, partial [Rhizobiales bacterium]|nr:LysR family transcriptional regulator [Hyphomicrobiales bacterium]